jgi:diacylglycerol kinase (ATP)
VICACFFRIHLKDFMMSRVPTGEPFATPTLMLKLKGWWACSFNETHSLLHQESPMNQQNIFTFTGRLRSLKYALAGIFLLIKSQHNAWVHCCATVSVVTLGVSVGLSRNEWCWVVLAIAGVWTSEALNTAFEFVCDVASPEFHPLVKSAKDIAAGSVLMSAMAAMFIGGFVFGDKLW